MKLDQHKEHIIKSYLDGQSTIDLGKEFDEFPSLITHSLKVWSIPTRSAGETARIKRDKKYIGKEFNKLTVVEYDTTKNKKPFYVFKCECGSITSIALHNVIRGHTKSCGCIQFPSGKNHHQYTGVGDISGNTWSHFRQSAIARNYGFNVTIQEGWELFLKQDRKCALSGLEIYFPTGIQGSKNRKLGTASMDRIDSTIREYKDNYQWVHKHINMMKQAYSQEHFIEMCRLVTNTARRNKKIIK